jgi:hypothetical protein
MFVPFSGHHAYQRHSSRVGAHSASLRGEKGKGGGGAKATCLFDKSTQIEAGGVSGVPSTFFGPDRRLVREDQVVLVQGSKSKAVSCLMFSG